MLTLGHYKKLSTFKIENRELATLIYVKVLYANRVDGVIVEGLG